MLRLHDTMQQIETTIDNEGVHAQCCANNGEFSIFRAGALCG